jgi:hypothetical protein
LKVQATVAQNEIGNNIIGGCGVDLDNLIIAFFCVIDDVMKKLCSERRLRERGPDPQMFDSEVIAIESIGEFQGLDEDKAIFNYFRKHYAHFFPTLGKIHRTTFTRQAANLWQVKQAIWQYILTITGYDPGLSIMDSFPIAACYFARAKKCRRFRGEAGYGKDRLIKQTFYGFRMHVHLNWPGVITDFTLTPANTDEKKVVPELVNQKPGLKLGDRNYWDSRLKTELMGEGITLEASFKLAKFDPWPPRSTLINHFRYRIETVFSQLTERFQIKKVWARDLWHFTSRLLRKILSHTLCFTLNQFQGNSPLQFAKLVDY